VTTSYVRTGRLRDSVLANADENVLIRRPDFSSERAFSKNTQTAGKSKEHDTD
jgi:hypothetical protein